MLDPVYLSMSWVNACGWVVFFWVDRPGEGVKVKGFSPRNLLCIIIIVIFSYISHMTASTQATWRVWEKSSARKRGPDLPRAQKVRLQQLRPVLTDGTYALSRCLRARPMPKLLQPRETRMPKSPRPRASSTQKYKV